MLARSLQGRTQLIVGDRAIEQGSLIRGGRQFDVYLAADPQQLQVELLDRLPRAPRVAIELMGERGKAGDAHYTLTVAVDETLKSRRLGAAFEDRLRIAIRNVIETPRADLGGGRVRLNIVMEPPRPDARELAILSWAGGYFHQDEYTNARIALDLSLAMLAQAPSDGAPSGAASPTPRVVPPPVVGYLARVSLERVKCLDAITWELGERPGFHVVLGQNASGKTGLLRAITAALLSHDEVGALRVDWAQWVRQGRADARCELQFADGAAAGWRIADGALEKTGHAWAGFSAAYGPFRRFTGGDLEYVREFKSQRRLLRHLSLFSERVALSDALEWLQDLEFRQSKQMPGAEIRDEVVAFVNETGLLPAGVALSRIDPDGVRVVAVAGVVVIDEVDAHLHATWQQRIGRWFKEHFPRFQFLVATHSAIVCQAADGVLLLPDPGTGGSPRMLSGVELDRVRYGDLLDAFDTGAFGEGVTRSEESRRKLERLAELNTAELHRELSDAERDEQRGLRHVLPSTAFTTERGAP